MDERELEIEYPTQWEYRLIGRDAGKLRVAAAEAVGEDEYELRFARQSSKGSYVSMMLTLEVRDEVHRKRLWDKLAANECVVRLL
jgi:putative lipoic acid-binding regulatory protein